jgi:hypothetical protein
LTQWREPRRARSGQPWRATPTCHSQGLVIHCTRVDTHSNVQKPPSRFAVPSVQQQHQQREPKRVIGRKALLELTVSQQGGHVSSLWQSRPARFAFLHSAHDGHLEGTTRGTSQTCVPGEC